jgi:hypothetical protein
MNPEKSTTWKDRQLFKEKKNPFRLEEKRAEKSLHG